MDASPPPEKVPARRKAILAAAIGLTCIIVMLVFALPLIFQKPQENDPDLEDGDPNLGLGTRVNQTSPGNWTVYIAGGSKIASHMRVSVFNHTIGQETVNKIVSNLAPDRNDPDAVFNDANSNSRIDAGDTIILKASGGHVAAGNTVRFLHGDIIFGTIRALPADIG
jgi:hypothetical protein